jgi:uncharacterized repeat protein (TIGR01451 family)
MVGSISFINSRHYFCRWLTFVVVLALLLPQGWPAPVEARSSTGTAASGPSALPVPGETILPAWFVAPPRAETAAPVPPAPGTGAPPAMPFLQSTTSLTVTKSDSPDPAYPGEFITYIITATNNGPTRTTGVFVEDYTPANTTFKSAVTKNNGSNGGDDWLISSPTEGGTGLVQWIGRPLGPATGDSQLDVGEYAVFKMEVWLDSPLVDGTIITNTVVVSASNALITASATITTAIAAPRLTLAKIASSNPVTPGTPLTYTVYITNSGGYTMPAPYTLTERVPEHLTFGPGSYTDPPAQGYDPATRIISWVLTNAIPPASSVSAAFVVTVEKPLTNGLLIVNDLYTVTSPSLVAPVPGSPMTVTVRSWPELTLVKGDAPDPVQAGSVLTYTLVVTNEPTATGPAFDLVVTDTVPEHAFFLTATGGTTVTGPPVGGSGVVTWEIPLLAVGASRVFTLAVTVTTPLTNNTIITNFYGATASNILTPPTTIPATTTVRSAPVITVSKSVWPANVPKGGTVTYTIAITNSGNESALLTVTDRLSNGFSFNGMIAPPNPTDSTPPDIAWSSLPVSGRNLSGTPGTLTLAFTSTAPFTDGIYLNLVTVTFGLSVVTTGPTAPVSVGNPELHLVKRDTQDPVEAGELLTYTLTYSNASVTLAYGLFMTDRLPANTNFVATSGDFASFSGPAGGVITWFLPPINVADGNKFITLLLSVTKPLPNGTLLTNAARISEPVGSSVTAVETTTVSSRPILHIVKSGTPSPPDKVQAGGRITYTLTVSNTGNAEAQNAVITDVLPANTTWASGGTYIAASKWVSITIGTLGLNTPQSYNFVVTVDSPLANGTIITDELYAVAGSGAYTRSTVPITVAVSSVHTLTVSKSDAPDPVPAGGLLTYTINYTVTGGESAVNVIVTDTVPQNTIFQSASGGISPVGGVLTWSLGTLTPTASGTLTFTVRLTSPLPNGTVLTNTARIFDGLGAVGSDTITTTVSGTSVLTVTKNANPDPVAAGALLNYTIVYSVEGNAPVYGAAVTDSVPGNTAFVSASGGVTPVNGVLTWTLGTLNPPASGTLTFTVQAASPLPNGTVLTNSAYFFGGSGQKVSDIVTTTVTSSHTLAVAKGDLNDPVAAGARLTYTISYTVTGNEAASSATISDTVPVNTWYANCYGGVSCSESSGVVRWSLGTVNPGASGVVTLVVTVTAPLLDNTILTNTALFSDAAGLKVTAVETTAVVAVDLYVTKTVEPPVALPGWIVTYTITYQNRGSITATNVLITDTVPLSLTKVYSSSGDATSLGGTMPNFTWQHSGNLGPGASGTIVITGPLAYTPWGPLTSTLTNTVVITASGLTPDAGNPANPNRGSVTHLARPGDPCTVTLVAVPVITTVDYVVALTATVGDCWGNRVLNGTPITLSSSLASSRVTPASTTTSNGVATAWLSSTLPGTTTVVAAWPGNPAVSDTAVVTFTLGTLDHFAFSYIASPQPACNGSFTIAITAQDRYSNTLTTYNGTASLTDSTGSIRPTSVSFASGAWSGLVTITVPMRSDVITASDSISPAIIGVSNPFSVTPGPPNSRMVSYTSPISICGATSQITTTVYDACGNLVWAGVPVTYSLVAPIRGSLPGGTSYSTATDDRGQATAVFTSGSTAGSQWFLVLAGELAPLLIMPGIQVVAPGLPTQLLLEAVPNPIPISGTSTVTATLRDCAGSAIAGANVTFSSSALGTLYPTSGATNGSGIVTTVFTAGPNGGVAIVTATAGSLAATTPITILTGGVTTVTVVAVPDTLPANGSSTTTITATVVNTGGSPVAGQWVTLVILPTLGGTFLTPASGNTNAAGVFTATWQAGTTAGVTTVTATADSRYGTAPLTLTAGTPATVTVYAWPNTLPANGSSTTTITATVVNTYYNPVGGVTVVLTVTPSFGGSFVTPNSGATNANGVFTATWRSGTVSGVATVTATVVGLTPATNTITLISTPAVSGPVYLPIILKNWSGPVVDLLVQSIQVIPPSPAAGSPVEVRVVISNSGPDSVYTPFWVDLYIRDSDFAMPTVNQRWNDLVSYGVAWRVYTIPANSTLTLTNLWPNDLNNPDPLQRCYNYSNFTPPSVGGCGPWYYLGQPNNNAFPHSGTWYIKAQVDSYSDAHNAWGEVRESNEANNTFSLPTVGVTGLSVGELAPPPLPSAPASPPVGPRPTVGPSADGD